MEIEFTEIAKEHLNQWKRSGNKTILKKNENLLKSIDKEPFTGLGKPKLLKYNWAGLWYRRINQKDRLVYQVKTGTIVIYSLKGYYK